MDRDLFSDYIKIVNRTDFPTYKSPEDQARAIKRCTILEPTTIGYSDRTSVHMNLDKQ